MLEPGELADLQAAQEELLVPDLVGVLERTATRDATGGSSASWELQADRVPGRLGLITDSERQQVASRLEGPEGYVLTVPVDAGVSEATLVEVGVGGQVYRVTAQLSGGSLETARRLAVVETRDPRL